MNNAQRLKILNKSNKTVFSLQGLAGLWQSNIDATKTAVKRMVEDGLVSKITKGFYSLNEDFNIFELANLIITPSYISLHSALFYQGIAFQLSDTVSSVALLNYERKIGARTFKYYSMKKSLFLNLEGISYKKNLAMAVPERAILDAFYFGALPNLDNWDAINTRFLQKLSLYYPKAIQKKVDKLIKA